MTVPDIPNELLSLVFRKLQRKTLYQCIYVCKSWSTTAIEEYMKHVCLSGDSIVYIERCLERYNWNTSLIKQFLTNGHLVRSLKIYNDDRHSQSLVLEHFLELVHHLPNLKKLDLEFSDSRAKYLEYMNKFLKRKTSNKKLLNSLEQISTSSIYFSLEMRDYIQVCYALRNNITHFYLKYLEQAPLYALGQPDSSYLDILPYMKRLTHLSIENQFGTDVLQVPLHTIIKACPKLSNIKLINFHTRRVDNSTGTLTAKGLAEQEDDDNHDLKVLEVTDTGYVSIKCLLTLITPHYLHTLTLYMEGDIFDVWVDECGQDALEQFGNYLRRVNYLDISLKNMWRKNPINMHHLLTLDKISPQNRVNNFNIFIDSISKGRNLICSLTLDFIDHQSARHNYVFQTTIHNGKLCVRYGFTYEEQDIANTASALNQLSLLQKYKYGSEEEKKLKKPLASSQSIIYSLQVNAQQLGASGNNILIREILYNVITNCPYITHISLFDRCIYESKMFKLLNHDGYVVTTKRYQEFTRSSSAARDYLQDIDLLSPWALSTYPKCESILF
jgi:hypothetical protein